MTRPTRAYNSPLCGHKICPQCGHWRILCDFPPATRKGIEYVGSWCRYCERVGEREAYSKLTEEQRDARRERVRFELHRKAREAGIPMRERGPRSKRKAGGMVKDYCPAWIFYKFMMRRVVYETLNETDQKMLRRIEAKEFNNISLDTADKWCTRYDLDLWELEDYIDRYL